jgi:hypothetical protein
LREAAEVLKNSKKLAGFKGLRPLKLEFSSNKFEITSRVKKQPNK